MLLLEAMKLSADPEFSEFKPLMALARHAINLIYEQRDSDPV